MPASNTFNQILAKFEQLKKAWESKKLTDTEKLLLDLKIAFASNFGCDHVCNEKVMN